MKRRFSQLLLKSLNTEITFFVEYKKKRLEFSIKENSSLGLFLLAIIGL